MSKVKIAIIMIFLILISCRTTAPLPSSINIYTPRSDVPTDIAAFSGVWEGKWNGFVDIILVVYYVDIYRAEVIFSKGWFSIDSPDSYKTTLTATVNNNIPSIYWSDYYFNEWHFVMNSNLDELTGQFIEKRTGSKGYAYMHRIQADEIPNVRITYRSLP